MLILANFLIWRTSKLPIINEKSKYQALYLMARMDSFKEKRSGSEVDSPLVDSGVIS